MLKNSLKEIKVRDFMKGTKAATFRYKVLLGIWAFSAITSVPFIFKYMQDEPDRKAKKEEERRLKFEREKEMLAYQRILLESQKEKELQLVLGGTKHN